MPEENPVRKYPMIRQVMNNRHPALFRSLCPRQYKNASNYCPPEIPATMHSSMIAAWQEFWEMDIYAETMVATGASLLTCGVPTYHVHPDIARDVLAAKPPGGTRWTDLTLPFPAGLFLLPKGFIKDADGRAFDFVSWARTYKGQRLPIPHARSMQLEEELLFFCTASADDPMFYGMSKSLNAAIWPSVEIPRYDAKGDLTLAERDAVHSLACLCMGLLLLMQCRPELVDKGREIQLGVAKKNRPPIHEPTWVGRNYRSHAYTPKGGTHASPAFHFRGSHWTYQVCGNWRTAKDFVSAKGLPRTATNEIDWEKVDEDTRVKFWKHHKHLLLPYTEIMPEKKLA